MFCLKRNVLLSEGEKVIQMMMFVVYKYKYFDKRHKKEAQKRKKKNTAAQMNLLLPVESVYTSRSLYSTHV